MRWHPRNYYKSKSKLMNLKPVLDDDEKIRAGTKLQPATYLSHDMTYLIILQRKKFDC